MKIIKSKYLHYINDNINIVTNSKPKIYNLYIVYYINCLVNPNYFDWLYYQLKLVERFNGTIYIIATLNKRNEEHFMKRCLFHFPDVKISCNYVNEFEYPGILKVWELGQIYKDTNDIILYFHSKGVTRNRLYESNKNDNYNIILKDINEIYDIFTTFPSIDKIGYYSGGIGWIWYNFWYSRGSYIHQVEKPIKTSRRHYYEDWLSRKVLNGENIVDYERPHSYYPNTLLSCYGFYTDKRIYGNIGSYYCPNKNKMFNLKIL